MTQWLTTQFALIEKLGSVSAPTSDDSEPPRTIASGVWCPRGDSEHTCIHMWTLLHTSTPIYTYIVKNKINIKK